MVTIFAYVLLALALGIIVTLRVIGIDLTEGQLLIAYWRWWALSITSIMGGLFFLNFPE